MVNTYSSLVLLHLKSTQNKVMTVIYIYNRSIYQYIRIHTQDCRLFSYRVNKNCLYRVSRLQELKQNESRTSCQSNDYLTNFQEK